MDKNKIKLFVYGTLKKGHGNNSILKTSNGIIIGKGHIKGFKIYSLGPFPALNKTNSDNDIVHGELYEIENLELTDMLEGYPYMYNRILTKCFLSEDTAIPNCWVYVYNQDLSEKLSPIPENEWR